MTPKKRGLGRGLDALLGAAAEDNDTLTVQETISKNDRLQDLPVEIIQRGKYQPRTHMSDDALKELAASIRAQGVMQPVVVRPIAEGRYELIAGERRWRATQMAGLTEIPAVIRDVPDETAMAMALIENIQREDLNPIEESLALQRLISEFNMTHEQAAQAVGRSRAAVTNLLRLLELNPAVNAYIERGFLAMGHARALLALSKPLQLATAEKIADQGLSVRQTEGLVRKLLEEPTEQSKAEPDADVKHLEQQLSEKLCAKIQIKHAQSGKGSLTIGYNSLDELDGILARIN